MSKIVTVPESFVREAHAVACESWKNKIEKQFPELFSITVANIQKLPEFLAYKSSGFGNVEVSAERIKLNLPPANTNWTFSAWKLAMAIIEKWPNCYPVHFEGQSVNDLVIKIGC